ncbi:MAG: cell division protein FtsA [Bacteroidaceae bacterium]|nr:cell division protein FtsA [Bacteroidaceae bacterium]
MGAEKNIVAIELGSSSIRAIIGQKRADGTLQVLGFEKENAPDSIRKGVVYNIDKTIQAITAIKGRLEERQKVFVNRVYVGVSGQSLRTVGNSVRRQLDVKVAITDEIVDSLMDENRAHLYPGAEVLDVLPQDYRVGAHLTSEPVGIMADRIEGYYKNIVARRTLRESIGRCLQGAKLEVADYFISPLLLSGYLLSDTEKRSGCALVDFGAETTTVAIYEKNILRHLAVLPLGGANITADLANSLHIEHDEAENLKHSYGSAYTEEGSLTNPRQINISNDRVVDEKRLLNIIEARQQEILANVWEQIKEYADRLLAGIVFTGGAANMKNLETAFMNFHHFDRVKTRLMPTTTEYTTSLKLDPQTVTLATLVAMLRRGDQECTSEKPAEPDLFDENNVQATAAFNQTPSAPAAGEGVVRPVNTTETAEAATPPETEETPETPETPKNQEPTKPKEPSVFKKIGKWITELVEEN